MSHLLPFQPNINTSCRENIGPTHVAILCVRITNQKTPFKMEKVGRFIGKVLWFMSPTWLKLYSIYAVVSSVALLPVAVLLTYHYMSFHLSEPEPTHRFVWKVNKSSLV